MEQLLIAGGRPLSGSVEVHGAKNSVLPILAATLLSGGECMIENCPRLSDVAASIRILEHLGCQVIQRGSTVWVDAGRPLRGDVPDGLMREMRSSVIFLGAILARLGEAVISYPGGCELGPRPIDLHLEALRRLGAEVEEDHGALRCRAAALAGREIPLSIPRVGAAEGGLLAAGGAAFYFLVLKPKQKTKVPSDLDDLDLEDEELEEEEYLKDDEDETEDTK